MSKCAPKDRITVITRSRRHETQHCDVQNTFQSSNDDGLEPIFSATDSRADAHAFPVSAIVADSTTGMPTGQPNCAVRARGTAAVARRPNFPAAIRAGPFWTAPWRRPTRILYRLHNDERREQYVIRTVVSLRFVTILASTTRSSRNVVIFHRCWSPHVRFVRLFRSAGRKCNVRLLRWLHTACSGF